jgi:hypothetical protein
MASEQLMKKLFQFAGEFADRITEDFEGQTIGEDGCTKEDWLASYFQEFINNGGMEQAEEEEKVEETKDDSSEQTKKKEKKKKKKSDDPEKPKKKRALSGYTYYGQQNKDSINQEIQELVANGGEKPKYLSFVSDKWKSLSEEEQEEWKEKAKNASQ